jgi:hypothetical protein
MDLCHQQLCLKILYLVGLGFISDAYEITYLYTTPASLRIVPPIIA